MAVGSTLGADDHVGRRALQHRHVRGLLRQRRDHADRGRAAADDHQPLAGVVEVLRPMLRVHHLALEVFDAGKRWRVGLVVVVVAGAEEQEPSAVGLGLAVLFGLHRPSVGGRIPVGGADIGVEPDVLVDAVLARGVGHVLPDLVAVGDHLRPRPRFPREAQRVDVAVGANAGIAEQIPRPAEALTSFQDRVAQVRVLLADAVGGADAGEPGADDQHIAVVSHWTQPSYADLAASADTRPNTIDSSMRSKRWSMASST